MSMLNTDNQYIRYKYNSLIFVKDFYMVSTECPLLSATFNRVCIENVALMSEHPVY